MTLTVPDIFSKQNSARLIRAVYCSGLNKTFAVWLSDLTQGTYFIARQNDGAYGSDFYITNVTEYIINFSIVEGMTPNEVIFFYETRDNLKYFIYNFSTRLIVVSPTIVSQGRAPSVNRGYVVPLFIYEREKFLQARPGVGAQEYTLLSTASHDVKEMDSCKKDNVQRFRYLGNHGYNIDIALDYRVDTDTEFLFDCRDEVL